MLWISCLITRNVNRISVDILHIWYYTWSNGARPWKLQSKCQYVFCMYAEYGYVKIWLFRLVLFLLRHVANGPWWIGEHDKTLHAVRTYPVLCDAHQPLLSVDTCMHFVMEMLKAIHAERAVGFAHRFHSNSLCNQRYLICQSLCYSTPSL